MDRIKDVKKLKLKPGQLLLKVTQINETTSGVILTPNSELILRHAEIVVKAPDVPDTYEIGDIVLKFKEQMAIPLVMPDRGPHANEIYAIVAYHGIDIHMSPDNFDLTKMPLDPTSKEGKEIMNSGKKIDIIKP